MSSDYDLDALSLTWVHPETGVSIYDEDMPRELKPWASRQEA